MEDYFSHNVALLKGRTHLIIAPDDDAEMRARIVPSSIPDIPSISVRLPDREILLHSKFDPRKDATRWAERLDVKSPLGVALLFGFGLGYHIEALLELHPELKKIVVFDASPDVMMTAFTARALDSLLTDPRVHIFAGPCAQIIDMLEKFLEQYTQISKDLTADVFLHGPSIDAMSDDSDAMRDILEQLRMSSRSAGVFAKERETNIAANMELFALARGAREVFGTLAGRPLIVAASGPSLDISLDIIKNAGRWIPDIVCVDSALAPMRKAGIEPRYVVSGDPQPHAKMLFDGIDIRDEELIFFPSSCPEVVRLFAPGKLIAACSEISGAERAIDAKYNKGMLFFSGTVLLPAVDFAVKSGATPLAIIGADFSFDDEKTHATGSAVQGVASRYGRLREIIGIDGAPVKTSDVFCAYLKELERYNSEKRGSTTIYNATARGAAVISMPHVSLARFIEECARALGE